MTYQEETQALADQARAQVLAALAAYVAGTLTYEALAGTVAAYLAAANSGAAALGDLALAAAVTVQTGRPAAPLGITRPADEAERLDRAAKTILEDLDREARANLDAAFSKAQMRLQRLVEAEVRQAVADAYSEAVSESEAVVGWTRGLEPEACQLCRWWWREGRIWDADHPFQHHTGCDCSQIIVTRKDDAA